MDVEVLHIELLARSEAAQILRWRYEAPFDFYNPPDHDDPEVFIQQFLARENGFHSVFDHQHVFIGFCSFGLDGQVNGGDYQNDALDIGLGMSPDLTGRGLGLQFVQTILAFGRQEKRASRLRLTVADFNQRAIKVYEQCGFQPFQWFCDDFGVPHTVMLLDC